MTRFTRDTAAEALGDGAYRVRMDSAWWVVRGPNGGYVAACLVNAMRGEVDETRALRSLTIHYAAAPAEGEARVDVRVERSGRSMSTVSARMTQGDRVLALALAAFSSSYPGDIEYGSPMPDVSPPESLARVPQRANPIPFALNFDQRHVLGAPPMSGADEALTGGWIALADEHNDEYELDEPLLCALTDAWWPAPFSVLHSPRVAPTIDLTVHLRAPLPRPADFVFIEVVSHTARDGFFEEDVRIWGRDGTLLAQSRQLALLL